MCDASSALRLSNNFLQIDGHRCGHLDSKLDLYRRIGGGCIRSARDHNTGVLRDYNLHIPRSKWQKGTYDGACYTRATSFDSENSEKGGNEKIFRLPRLQVSGGCARIHTEPAHRRKRCSRSAQEFWVLRAVAVAPADGLYKSVLKSASASQYTDTYSHLPQPAAAAPPIADPSAPAAPPRCPPLSRTRRDTRR